MSANKPDSPSIPVLLEDGSNYIAWKARLLAYLDMKGLDFVIAARAPDDRSVLARTTPTTSTEDVKTPDAMDAEKAKKPPSEKTAEKEVKTPSEKAAKEVYFLILCSIKDALVAEFQHIKTASKIMDALDQRFGKLYKPSITARKRQLMDIKLEEDGNMEKYLLEFTRISNELKTAGATVADDDLVMYAMAGLPPSYDALKHVLDQQKNLDFQTLKAKLLREDAARKASI